VSGSSRTAKLAIVQGRVNNVVGLTATSNPASVSETTWAETFDLALSSVRVKKHHAGA
jgi:hypothetical protein